MLQRHACGFISTLVALIPLFDSPSARAETGSTNSESAVAVWARENLHAWCTVPFDARRRGPEERAQMLKRLGFKHLAYDWRAPQIPTFDAEIDALKKYDIELIAWWFPFDADDPLAKATLEVFKRHNVHPQLWVVQSPKGTNLAKSAAGISSKKLQELRVEQEADRIHALVKLAAPYGSTVQLYNDNGWFGRVENQAAVVERLKERGVTDVGMVYNFSHARDSFHDDTVNFAPLWEKIQQYVVAVNITGTQMEGIFVYPSQGDRELEMMRIIQNSGWKGSVGLIAEKGGDAEITLSNYLLGFDWLVAQIREPDSGGPRPFRPIH